MTKLKIMVSSFTSLSQNSKILLLYHRKTNGKLIKSHPGQELPQQRGFSSLVAISTPFQAPYLDLIV